MLPSYTAAMQQKQRDEEEQHQHQQEQQEQLEQQMQSQDLESDVQQQQQPSFRSSYEGLHASRSQLDSGQHLRQRQASAQRPSSTLGTVKDGTLDLNLTFLQSPAGGLLAASSVLGLVVGICGAVPAWSLLSGGHFTVFSGLLHFSGGSLLFFAYLYNFISEMPWYTRALAIYYYVVSAGVSLIAFVYSASSGSYLLPAAIASAVFTFLAMAVDIVLIVLSYIALKMGYAAVQSSRDPNDV